MKHSEAFVIVNSLIKHQRIRQQHHQFIGSISSHEIESGTHIENEF
jgi:hypothetical protein